MDDLGTGVITKLTDGRFDGQYQVEITLTDGTVLGGYDGISVYEKKQDGSPAKVWPMVQESKFKGVPFFWKGNVKESETKGGTKTYATIVWAEPAEDVGGANGGSGEVAASGPSDDWSVPESGSPRTGNGSAHQQAEAAPTVSPASSKDDYWARREVKDEVTQRMIVASWAIEQAIRIGQRDSNGIHEMAHNLIIMRDRIATELAE